MSFPHPVPVPDSSLALPFPLDLPSPYPFPHVYPMTTLGSVCPRDGHASGGSGRGDSQEQAVSGSGRGGVCGRKVDLTRARLTRIFD